MLDLEQNSSQSLESCKFQGNPQTNVECKMFPSAASVSLLGEAGGVQQNNLNSIDM